MKAIMLVLGIVVLAAGVLFALQGGGIVHWPPESTMLDQREWIARGGVIALIGLALIAAARRMRR